jgi:hypothetical protein
MHKGWLAFLFDEMFYFNYIECLNIVLELSAENSVGNPAPMSVFLLFSGTR